jgi:hypothetical protein
MSKTHIVKQGEHLSSIAQDNGFANFHTIFDHPNNADLKAKRDPHVLFPGDQLFIPDRQLKTEQGATTLRHTFTIELQPLFLRLRVLDLDGQAVASAKCDVRVEGAKDPDDGITTNAKGILTDPIKPTDHKADVIVHVPPPKPAPPKKGDPPSPPPTDETIEFDVKIGHLNPKIKLSGQQARLNNMGYFAGYSLNDLDQLLWAAEEFECDNLQKPVAKRPDIQPAPVEGEDDETKTDPDSKTGIQDTKIVDSIEKVHGF